MSARPILDSMRFARSGDTRTGEVRVVDLDRLVDFLESCDGEVKYRLHGGMEAGWPALALAVDVAVSLRCQRCLESYRQDLSFERVFRIARDEAQLDLWEREDPLIDALIAEPEMAVLTLIEDEILLSLPVAPRHPDGECGQTDT